MKKIIAAFSCLLMVLGLSANQVEPLFLNIATENSSLVLGVGQDEKLYIQHYGAPVGCEKQFAGYQTGRRVDYGTDDFAYPARGGRYYNQPALAVCYADGDCNTELTYVSHTITQSPSVVKTEILLRDVKTLLEVTLIYEAYQKEDVIVSHSVIKNGGKKRVYLDSYASSSMAFPAGKHLLTHFYGSGAREMQVAREILTPGVKTIQNRMGIRTTHTENPSFLLSLHSDSWSETQGEVVAGALAWSGNYKLDFQMDESQKLVVIAGINPEAARYPLDKGAEFETPNMIWTWSGEGAGRASRNLHDWSRRYQCYSQAEVVPTLLNSWEGAYFDFTTRTLTDMIDDAADMGLEMFVLDDGWFASGEFARNDSRHGLGDWEVNAEKLPEGIDYIADYAHQKGLKFGIWIEPEMVNKASRLAQEHPEWIVQSKDRELTTTRGQWVLDLTNPQVQDFVFGVFDRTMQLSDHIDYIKWDCNRHVESFGSTYLKDQERFYVDYTQALYKIMRRIRAKYPEVIIQSCSSGGGRVDYGALAYFDEVWTSDNTEALSRVFIQYGTNLIYPACVTGSHVSAVPSHQTGNMTPLKFRFDIAAAGRIGMELQPKDLTAEEKVFARQAISSYKTYRDLVFSGDLYRLCSPYDGNHYAIMYALKDKSRAVVMAYCIRYQARTLKPYFRLQGLDPDKEYKIYELNTENSSFWGNGKVFSGKYLMNHGINPALLKLYDSAIFMIEENK